MDIGDIFQWSGKSFVFHVCIIFLGILTDDPLDWEQEQSQDKEPEHVTQEREPEHEQSPDNDLLLVKEPEHLPDKEFEEHEQSVDKKPEDSEQLVHDFPDEQLSHVLLS